MTSQTSPYRVVLGIALTPVLALAAAAPAAAHPAAAGTATGTTAATAVETRAPGPWGARTLHAANPVPASASGGLNVLESAGNGALVSLTGDGLSRSTRIRPAGGTRWLAPQTWPDAGGYNTELVSLGDGSVRLVWRAERADDHNNHWLKVATLAPGATAFSAPEYVAAVPEKGYHHLAAAPDGRLVAVWSASGVVKAAGKAGPRAAWTAPADLNTQPPSGSRDVSALDLAVAKDGTALVVWQWQASKAVVALEKAPARPPGRRSRTSRSRAWTWRARRRSPVRRAASTCSTTTTRTSCTRAGPPVPPSGAPPGPPPTTAARPG